MVESILSEIYRWLYHPDRLERIPPDLCQAFSEVLQRIPDDARRIFFAHDPLVACLHGCRARVERRFMPSPSRRYLHMMYFNADPALQTKRGLLHLVAHETAHIVLGHLENPSKPDDVCEAEVEALVQRWGFERSNPSDGLDLYETLLSSLLWLRKAICLVKYAHEFLEAHRAHAAMKLEVAESLLEDGLGVYEQKRPVCATQAQVWPRPAPEPDSDSDGGSDVNSEHYSKGSGRSDSSGVAGTEGRRRGPVSQRIAAVQLPDGTFTLSSGETGSE